jgi:hypothetical protein
MGPNFPTLCPSAGTDTLPSLRPRGPGNIYLGGIPNSSQPLYPRKRGPVPSAQPIVQNRAVPGQPGPLLQSARIYDNTPEFTLPRVPSAATSPRIPSENPVGQ